MNTEQLQEHLRQLDQEIQQAGSLDERTRQLLENLEKEIEKALQAKNQSGEIQQDPSSVSPVPRLEKIVEDFESSHPQMTKTIQNLINALSSMGI